MNWIKEIKTHWMLTIVALIFIAIWVPPLLMETAEKIPETVQKFDSKIVKPISSLVHPVASMPPDPEKPAMAMSAEEPEQPILLTYADWLIANWQTILSILTILPIVIVRWKSLLTGKPVESKSE